MSCPGEALGQKSFHSLVLVIMTALTTVACRILVERPQIWIAEIEYYKKMSSHAQIGLQGAEKQPG